MFLLLLWIWVQMLMSQVMYTFHNFMETPQAFTHKKVNLCVGNYLSVIKVHEGPCSFVLK